MTIDTSPDRQSEVWKPLGAPDRTPCRDGLARAVLSGAVAGPTIRALTIRSDQGPPRRRIAIRHMILTVDPLLALLSVLPAGGLSLR
jgi:hypothetical protein